MPRIIPLFYLLVSLTPLYGQKTTESRRILYILEGSIAASPATMVLSLPQSKGERIEGFYYYNRYKKNIPLGGSFTAGGALEFAEFAEDNTTNGIFKGSFDPAKGFSGTWAGGEKTNLPVELKPSSGPLRRLTLYTMRTQASNKGTGWGGEPRNIDLELSYSQFLLDNPLKNPVIDRINGALGSASEGAVLKGLAGQIQGIIREWVGLAMDDRYNTDISDSWQLLTIDAKFLGLANDTHAYMGGAHGNSARDYRMFSMETGEPIAKAKDILKDPDDPSLVALLRRKLLLWPGEASPEKEIKDMYFDFDKIRLNNNFLIEPGGVRFIYNQYEIASYAFGQPEVFFTFEELKPFLKKDGPLGYLLP